MNRVYNFAAGPAVLPEEVLREAAQEMLDYRGAGLGVMEMSHRSKEFDKILNDAKQDLIDLMGIPDEYEVLFVQGGGSQQFAAVPMNLMKNKVADYIVTGQWAKKAMAEAKIYGQANKIASSEDKTYTYIPDVSDLPISENADYVYICENNTIYGTTYKELPNTKGKILQDIKVSLGGRIAEEMIMDDITTGASQDIKQATAAARAMVVKYGMSDELGLINYETDNEEETFVGRDIGHQRMLGEATAAAIDKEVKRIIDECYADARRILEEHIDVLHKCAERLLEKERIDREEFESLFA